MSARWSEIEFIKSLANKGHVADDNLVFGIGDDCAVINQQAGKQFLVTTDMLVEGVHFDLSWHPPEALGEKCIAVNLSDIAAMGGRPRFAFISIAIPESINNPWLSRWSDGVTRMLERFNCVLAGGDTVYGKELTVNVTIFGDVEPKKAVYRHGASAGQHIFVSGPLGSAAAGLILCRDHRNRSYFNTDLAEPFKKQHLSPVPEVELGTVLAESGMVTAMQDISDGIATDIAHLCCNSGVGAIINEELLPQQEGFSEMCRMIKLDSTELQISGGEDYRLVFTVEEGKDRELIRYLERKRLNRVSCIGKTRKEKGVLLVKEDTQIDISFKGYEHTSQG